MSATEPAADAARLKVELWAARDAAIGAEAAAGQLRGRVKELESTLDDRDRHIEALLARVASLQERLDTSEAQRDAVLSSEAWRLGQLLVRPRQLLRRSARRTP